MAMPAETSPATAPSRQAMIDELESMNEQQQSVIEELLTVNNELKIQVEETARANDDLNNLIVAVDLPTVFVDREMRLQRYTPRTTEHLREREVRSHDGHTHIVRLLPYRTVNDRIDGVVLTFFDVSLQRDAEGQQTFLLQLGDMLRSSADPSAILLAASRLLREHFGLERVVFWEAAGDGEMVPCAASYAPGTMNSSPKVRLADFGPKIAASLQAGEVVVRDETADDQALAGVLGPLLAAENLAELNAQLAAQVHERTTALQVSEERVRALTTASASQENEAGQRTP